MVDLETIFSKHCATTEVESEIEEAGPPHRTSVKDAEGLLVGFYSVQGAGQSESLASDSEGRSPINATRFPDTTFKGLQSQWDAETPVTANNESQI